MRKAILVTSAVLAVTALVFADGDPWKTKPYQQWDDKDVQRILHDSPWSKVVQVIANWKNRKLNSNDDSDQPYVPTGAPAAGGKMGGMGSRQAAPSAPAAPAAGGGLDSGDPSSDPSTAVTFLVRWVSSRTVVKAVLRKAELAGQMKPEDAEKELAKQLDVYEVVVFGPDMRPFQSADEESLKTSANLIEKKTKQKISPVKVELSRSTDGKRVEVVVFIFPKKSDTGEPTIPPDEERVDFKCSLNGAKFYVSFDLSRMQDTQGRDL